MYFQAESFKDAKEKISLYAQKIPRPFSVRYNPYTQSVEIINNKAQIINIVKDIKSTFFEIILGQE